MFRQHSFMLSAYSAVNQGHRHPKIIQALKDQADKITLTSRAFHNDQLGPFYEKTAKLTGKDMILPMNTGAEAVESAVKAARRWAYGVKGVADNQAEIIACIGNFHGRTMLAAASIVLPWKLPIHAMISAWLSATPLTPYAQRLAALTADSTASAPVFIGRIISFPVSLAVFS